MSAALRSTRILTGVMVAVVFSFLLATFVTRMREQEMARWLSTLIGSAMPSVQQLSHARTELRRLMQELDAAADSGSPTPVRAVHARAQGPGSVFWFELPVRQPAAPSVRIAS